MKLTRTLGAAIAAAATLTTMTAAQPAAASGGALCASWTRSGTVGNDTGQPVRIRSSIGSLRHGVTVATDGRAPFAVTLPGRVARATVVFTVSSLDYSGGVHPVHGWRFTESATVVRPIVCG